MSDHQSPVAAYDAIVVGSGISGLTIALLLAKEGRKVALFEKDREIAPLIRPYLRKGCSCCPGLHTLGWMREGEVISSFFKHLQVSDGVEQVVTENGFGNLWLGPKQYHFPSGHANLEQSLITYFPQNATAVRNYLRLIKEVNDRTFYLNHQLTPVKRDHRTFGEFDHATLCDVLKQYQASQELIDLLGLFNYILMGSKADEVPFNVHAFVLGGYFESPGYFTLKGIKRLLANYQRELTRYGVDLFVNAEVDQILIGNERCVSGIKTVNGNQYLASRVIASFNPKLLTQTLPPDKLRPVYRGRLAAAENTFGLYVAFYQIAADIEIENFIYYDDNLDITLGATLNDSGRERVLCVFLVANDPNHPATASAKTDRSGEKLELLETVVFEKVPGLKGKTVLLDYLKPWSFERYTKTINGSAYGIKHTVNTMGLQHRVPLRGLYLVGQAIYPGFLGSLISSFDLALELVATDDFWARIIKQ